MKDPIDWPAFGMPEGVEVRFVQCALTSECVWSVRERKTIGDTILQLFGCAPTEGGCSTLVYGSMGKPDFPILEAFMRAARAIEAGKVGLTSTEGA